MAQNRRRENPNRNQSRPAQGNTARRRSRSNASGRRVYDQAQDARRASSQRRGSPQGYQEQTIDFANGSVRYEQPRRADNSIQFPRQGRQMSGSAGQNGAGRSRSAQDRARGRNGNGSTRPANGASRGTKNGPSGRMRPTEANLRSPSRRESKKKRKLTRAAIRRRRIIRRLTAFALLLCVIAAGVYLTVTMLFKISSIQVQTADGTQVAEAGGYASEQILQALGVHTEENIFSFDPGQKSKELEKAFPMLEFIHVERQYPGTVVVQVTEARPTYAMQVEGGWLTLSASLKILSKDAAQPAGLATLYGGEPVSTTPGEQLDFAAAPAASSAAASESADSAASSETEAETDQRLESLNTLMSALDSYGMLGDATRIEFADTEEMAFLYQDRISVLLGTLNELDYKLKLAQYVLLNQDGKGCAATDTGLLDLSHLSASSTRKFRFAQGEPTLPSGYIVPEVSTPEETPVENPDTAEADPPADTELSAETSAAPEADPAAGAETPPTEEAANQETTNQE